MPKQYGKPHRLERFRAKVKVKTSPEAQGQGSALAREATEANLKLALAQKKKSGKAVAELEKLDVAGLQNKLSEARLELFNLRFKQATSQLQDTASIRNTKRDIARILTLIKQKEVRA